jgi:hypothetical protein
VCERERERVSLCYSHRFNDVLVLVRLLLSSHKLDMDHMPHNFILLKEKI